MFPHLDIYYTGSPNQIKNYDTYYVFGSDINPNLKKNKPIAIFSNNGFGNGSFSILSAKNAFWIMSEFIETKIFHLLGIDIESIRDKLYKRNKKIKK